MADNQYKIELGIGINDKQFNEVKSNIKSFTDKTHTIEFNIKPIDTDGLLSNLNSSIVKDSKNIGKQIGININKTVEQSLSVDKTITKALSIWDKVADGKTKNKLGAGYSNDLKAAIPSLQNNINLLKKFDESLDNIRTPKAFGELVHELYELQNGYQSADDAMRRFSSTISRQFETNIRKNDKTLRNKLSETFDIKMSDSLPMTATLQQLEAIVKECPQAQKYIDKIKNSLVDLSNIGNITSIDTIFNELETSIKQVKSALGSIDDESGIDNILVSVNKISKALTDLNTQLSTLANKDFSINVGLDIGNMGKKNNNMIAYGRAARKQVIPELEAQIKELETLLGGQQATMKKLTSQGSKVGFDVFTDFNDFNSDSAIKKMEAMEKYVNSLKKLAALDGIKLDDFNEVHRNATELINDITGVEDAVDKASDVPEKIKKFFGGGIDAEGLSASLEPIVADLNQIREAVVNLSKGVSLEGLTSSFDRLSDTIEKLVSNVTLAKSALGNGLGSVASTAVPTINLDDVIDEQAMKLMNEYAITGSKAFDEIRQSLVDFRNGTGDINKVTSAISNNMKVINDAKDDYRELAEYIKMFNASGAKVHIPDSIRQEYGDDYKSMRSQLGKGFTSGKGMDFETFVEETNEILGQTIDLSHGAEAAFGDLVDKVNSAKGGKFLIGDDLFKNGILDMGDVVANVSTSLEQIEKAEEEVARTSTSVANTVVQNEERTTNAYQETSGVIENLKAALQTMKLDRSSIDAVIKDVEELGFTAKDASVAMKNGDFDITVNGVDNIGRAITEIRHLDSATGEITGISRKISQSLTETDKFVKQQKRAVTDLTNQINQLNRAATDQNANRPIKDSSHLDILEGKYNEITAAIQRMGNASSATFDDERNEVRKLISEYKSLKSEFKNAENVSMDFKGADFASGLEIAKNRLREFKADAKGFSQISQTVEELDRAIEGVGDKSSLDKFNDQLKVAKSELKAIKAEVSSDNGGLAAKIRIDIETEKFENQVSQLHNQLDQLTDVDGSLDKLRASIKQVDDAYDAMTKATDDESLIQAQKRFAAAVEKTNNELKIQTREQRAANNAAKLADSRAALKTDMLNWLQKNSKATKEYKSEIDRLIASLDKLDQAGVNGVRRKFKNIDRDAELKGLKGLNFFDSMKSKIKEYSVYFGAAEMFMYAEQGLRDMFEQVKLIDSAMTELKKVTNETDATYDKFLTNAADRAKAIGTTIDGLVSSTADFARLGYGFEDAQGLAEVANIYAVVGDEIDGVEGATESLISTMAAFKDEMNGMSNTDFAMSIIDKFNEIGNNFSISSGGIGEALERSASSLMAANNTIDESIALITAANTVVQDPEQVGKGYADIKSGYIG